MNLGGLFPGRRFSCTFALACACAFIFHSATLLRVTAQQSIAGKEAESKQPPLRPRPSWPCRRDP